MGNGSIPLLQCMSSSKQCHGTTRIWRLWRPHSRAHAFRHLKRRKTSRGFAAHQQELTKHHWHSCPPHRPRSEPTHQKKKHRHSDCRSQNLRDTLECSIIFWDISSRLSDGHSQWPITSGPGILLQQSLETHVHLCPVRSRHRFWTMWPCRDEFDLGSRCNFFSKPAPPGGFLFGLLGVFPC